MDEPRKLTTYPVPGPRVEGEAVTITRIEAVAAMLKHGELALSCGSPCNISSSLVVDVCRDWLSLTAEVERLRACLEQQALQFDKLGHPVLADVARLQSAWSPALALPTPAVEATNDGK